MIQVVALDLSRNLPEMLSPIFEPMKLIVGLILLHASALSKLPAATTIGGEAVLFSQGISAATQAPAGSAWSDFDHGANGHPAFAASAFALGVESALSSLVFEGRYTNDGVYSGNDRFSIAIMRDGGSLPGTIAMPSTQLQLDGRTIVGTGTSGSYSVNYYRYSLIFPTQLTLAAGNYWLAISNDTSVGNHAKFAVRSVLPKALPPVVPVMAAAVGGVTRGATRFPATIDQGLEREMFPVTRLPVARSLMPWVLVETWL